jgi:hypothetical protein
MKLVNMNELLNANINFAIVEKDVAFDSTGELIGYSEVGAGYRSDDRVEMEFRALCDTAELSDDAIRVSESRIVEVNSGLTLAEMHQNALAAAKSREVKAALEGRESWKPKATIDASKMCWERVEEYGEGRWAHVADADKAEKLAKVNLYHRLDVTKRPWGEMQEMTKWRKDRWARLLKFVDGCYCPKKLRWLQDQAWKRYLKGVKSCFASKDWYSQYLTKFEMNELSSIISDKRKAIFGGLKAPRDLSKVELTKPRKSRAKRKHSGVHLATHTGFVGKLEFPQEAEPTPVRRRTMYQP